MRSGHKISQIMFRNSEPSNITHPYPINENNRSKDGGHYNVSFVCVKLFVGVMQEEKQAALEPMEHVKLFVSGHVKGPAGSTGTHGT